MGGVATPEVSLVALNYLDSGSISTFEPSTLVEVRASKQEDIAGVDTVHCCCTSSRMTKNDGLHPPSVRATMVTRTGSLYIPGVIRKQNPVGPPTPKENNNSKPIFYAHRSLNLKKDVKRRGKGVDYCSPKKFGSNCLSFEATFPASKNEYLIDSAWSC